MRLSFPAKRYFRTLVLFPALGLAACQPLPPSKPASQWTPAEARGAQVFSEKCARCHLPDSARTLKGPGLQALTKVSPRPFAASLSDDRLTQLIQSGRFNMPPAHLSEDRMRDLLAYLHSL
jgi:mono/diheme cytochrome c family protein